MTSRWTRSCLLPALLLLASAGPGVAQNAAPTSIEAALRDADGDRIPDRVGETVTVRGRVIARPRTVGGTTTLVNLQDPTGGLTLVSRNAASPVRELRPGDVVEARGEIHQYRGTEELIVGDLRRVARSDVPKPMHVTAADLRGERFGGRLVHLTGELHVEKDANGQLRLELEDASGSIPVSVPNGLGTPQFQERLLRGGRVGLVGIAGQSTEDPPYDSGYLLAPRSPADFDLAPLPPYRAIGLGTLLLALGGLAVYLWMRHRRAARSAREMTLLAEGLRSSEQALRDSEARYRLLFDGGNDAVFVYGIDPEGNTTPFREVNHVACQRLGYTREELLRHFPLDFDAPEDLPAARLALGQLLSERHLLVERVHIARDGTRIPVEVNARVIDLHGQPTVISIARDVRERKQAEEALRQSEERLRQSQKMEAVGTLAGGVAHDFNNLLTVIKGNAEILLLELPDDDPARGDITEIQRAADRAAALTRQLLAFSRKQVLQPKVLALDEVVSELAPMLRRIIGEDVEMHTVAAPDLAPVRADPGQLQQVIMNLAANARDAMPRGGTLSIELANVEIDATAAATLPGLEPGVYAMLAVHDTGCGIDPATRAQIFDPFFTTKPQGTGLGLSTVYGIVQQSGGAVEVGSEPGRGTTFRIFLPRVEPPTGAQRDAEDPRAGGTGAETVLLVEDEDAVRTLARRVLERSGYRVLDVPSGTHALRLCEERGERVDLLLTDVVMPGMSGPTLAEALGTRWPGLRVLFISGYTDDALGKHGVLQTGVHFLEKPFPPDALARKVREVLDAQLEACPTR